MSESTSRAHWILRIVLALLALTAGFAPSPASAHTGLTGSTPSNGARLASRPTELKFTFDQTLQPVPGWDAVVVTGPDGARWPVHSVQIHGKTLTATCGHLGPAGAYSVSYRVISGDGHPVAGHIEVAIGRGDTGSPVMLALGLPGSGVPAWAWLTELALAAFLVVQACLRRRAGEPAAVPSHPGRPGSAPTTD